MTLKNWYKVGELEGDRLGHWIKGTCGCKIAYAGNDLNESISLTIKHCLNEHKELTTFKVTKSLNEVFVWAC